MPPTGIDGPVPEGTTELTWKKLQMVYSKVEKRMPKPFFFKEGYESPLDVIYSLQKDMEHRQRSWNI